MAKGRGRSLGSSVGEGTDGETLPTGGFTSLLTMLPPALARVFHSAFSYTFICLKVMWGDGPFP